MSNIKDKTNHLFTERRPLPACSQNGTPSHLGNTNIRLTETLQPWFTVYFSVGTKGLDAMSALENHPKINDHHVARLRRRLWVLL